MLTSLAIIFVIQLVSNVHPVISIDENEVIKKGHTMTFELHRQKSPYEQYINYGHHLKGEFDILHKHKGGSSRDNDSIALYRWLDNEFYGKVVIGHPGQTLNVAFDTSWSLSWVMSSKCASPKAAGCLFHNKYDHDKSSEYKKDGRPYSQVVGDFNLTGFFSYDNFSIAHSRVDALLFVEMVNLPNSFVVEKADGILGLGLKTDDYDPFFYKLINQKKIKNPIFSIYLNRDRQSTRGGNIMLGFIEPRHIHKNVINNRTVAENITYLDVANRAIWQFKMDKIIIDIPKKDPVILCGNNCNASVDSNSNGIFGPKADVDEIHDIIKAREFILGRYTVDCDTTNKLPKINFVLSGKNFTLAGPDYTVKLSYHSVTVCLSAFIPVEGGEPSWTLGGAFLSQYYSVYNIYEKKIGFVKAA